LALLALLLPIACAPQAPSRPQAMLRAPAQAMSAQGVAPGRAEPVRVGLLLPLSGGNGPLGEAMLEAAQLALFQQSDAAVEFLPRDTGGNPAGAQNAARDAMAAGARVLAGPLTFGETAAVVPLARGAGLPLFAFTSDDTQSGSGVWVLGVTPTQAVRRVAAAASAQGARRFGLVAPEDEFGRRLAAALRQAMQDLGGPPPVIAFYPPRDDPAGAAQQMVAAAPEAVLIGAGGMTARQIAQVLAAAPRPPRLLGTHLWGGDAEVAGEPALAGAWFPGPDPEARSRFEARFTAAFTERPPRLAGVAYDAAALGARAARDGSPPIGQAFMGADGPIRLDASGRVDRGLALFAVRPGGEPSLVQPAPAEPGGAGS
jgi:ABC-type branched-subunit amino acid transport system substrate-binding protein